eukprot:JP447096.1.p2 GENE.JP447096.1~~JP447096.1.p2  ORF type:complete len:69 (-),score=7.34 JP447096.1:371-577(-)
MLKHLVERWMLMLRRLKVVQRSCGRYTVLHTALVCSMDTDAEKVLVLVLHLLMELVKRWLYLLVIQVR